MQVGEIDFETSAYHQACELRNQILRIPIGLSLYDEDLSKEAGSRHFAVRQQDEVIAYLMIVPQPDHTGKLRQMCVSANHRGRGLGASLVKTMEEILRQEDYKLITMSARVEAIGFYQKLGYEVVSDQFLDVGIPHVTMEKRL